MLLDTETRYNTMEKMVLALVMVKKKLRHYFESHTIVVMKNFPIKKVVSKPDLSGRLTNLQLILGFMMSYMLNKWQKRIGGSQHFG